MTYRFAEEEGSFLAGVAAAVTTETGIVGFVGGMQAVGAVDVFQAGFEAGVASADPSADVIAINISTHVWDAFVDPQGGYDAAMVLFDRGADVVFHAAGDSGYGVFTAARIRSTDTGIKHWAIGVDSDQYHDTPAVDRPYVLTSALKAVDLAVTTAVDDFMAGQFSPTGRVFTLQDDGVGLGTSGGDLSSVDAQIARIEADIASGTIDVPENPFVAPLPPPGFVADATAAVVVDASGTCSHSIDPPAVEPSANVAITFENRSSGPAGVSASFTFDDGGNAGGAPSDRCASIPSTIRCCTSACSKTPECRRCGAGRRAPSRSLSERSTFPSSPSSRGSGPPA